MFWLRPPAPNHRRTCFGCDPQHLSGLGAKHISNPDAGAILKSLSTLLYVQPFAEVICYTFSHS